MLPFVLDLSVIFYNKKLYKEAGLDPEKGPATLEEFKQQALAVQKLGQPGVHGTYFGGNCGGCNVFTWFPMIWASGEEVMNPEGTQSLLDGPAAQKVYATWRELQAEGVRAVYDDVCARAMSALTSATTPREAVGQFVALMVDDPVRGRVLLLAPAVERVLVHSGAQWMPSFIDLLQHKLTQISDPVRQKMIATSLIGGLTALSDVSIDVQPGQIAGLVGPNGAGKSTLLAVLSGLLRANSGRVHLHGDDVTNASCRSRSRRSSATWSCSPTRAFARSRRPRSSRPRPSRSSPTRTS